MGDPKLFVNGTVTGSSDNIGGLAGFNDNALIMNSGSTGDVTGGTFTNVGGLVGLSGRIDNRLLCLGDVPAIMDMSAALWGVIVTDTSLHALPQGTSSNSIT